MNFFIKNITAIILLVVFPVSDLYSSSDCLSKYNCRIDVNGTKINGIKECHLPVMPTFDITVSDVLKSDGTLKRYWFDRSTVCDVLGWMNGAVLHNVKGTGYF